MKDHIKLKRGLFFVSDEAHVRGLIKKFGSYHDIRIYVGTAAFLVFTLAYFKSTN